MSERAGTSATDFWEDADKAEALQRYRTLVNTIDDGIYQLDADGRIVAVNDVIVELTGYPREELLGEHVSALLDGEDVAAIEREIERRLREDAESQATFEFEVRTADGDSIPCELRLNLLTDEDGLRGTIGVIRDVSERKRAERELSRRERELERERGLTDELLEASPMGVMVLDGEGEITQLNERARELLGIAESELREYSPGDRPTYDEAGNQISLDEHPFAEVLETGEPVHDRVLQVERPDGERRWLSVNAAPVLTDEGEVDRVITTGEDVTDIKERERKLEDELSEVFGRVTDAFYALDRDWNLTHVNDRAEELIDYRGEGLVGKNLWDVFEWAEDSTLGEEYREAMATQEPTSFEFYYPEPLEAWYEVHAYPSETGLSVYFRDVTERKERERTLREREAELSRLMDNVPGMVYRCRNERGWPMEFVSDACRELTGYDSEALERGDVEWGEEVVVAADREAVWNELQNAVTDREPFSITYRIETAEGERRWVRDHGRGVFDDEGELVRLEGIITDVTEQKRLETELSESEQRYRTLVENFPNGAVALVDSDLNYRTVGGDPITTDLTIADLESEPVADALPPELADELVPRYEAALDGEQSTFEIEFDGRSYQIRVVPVSDDDGDVFAALGMSQDITERKERERDLEEYRSRYQTLVEHFPNGAVALVDEDRRYVTFGGTPEVDEVTRAELEGRHLREGLPDELAEVVVPGYEAALDGETSSFEETVGDNVYQFHFVPVRDDDGEIFSALGMSQDVTEREEYQRRLEESERRYRALADNFPNGIVTLFDRDLKYTLVAGKGFEDIPVTPEEVEGKYFGEVWDEETTEALEPVFEAALDGEQQSVELSYAGREWVVHGVPITDERGDVFAGMTMAQDITEQKERERYLREAKSQLEAATEAGAVGTWEWHIPEDEFVTGASFARTFGVDPEAAREGVSIDRIVSAIHEEDRPRVQRKIEDAIESCGEYTEEYRVWNADDELRWVVARGHVECDDEGNPVRFPGALTDITERKRAERRLEENRRQLETLFEVLPVGVVVADGEGSVIEANETAKELWGVEAFDVDDLADYDRYRGWWADTGEPVSPEEWTLARVLDGEEVTDPDVFEIETADGEHRTIMVHGMPIRGPGGEVTRAVATMTDVTERREYQRQLEESERRYRTLVENFPNGSVGLYDETYTYRAVGGELIDDLGFSPDDILGTTIYARYPDELIDELEPNFRAVFDGDANTFEIDIEDRNLVAHTLPVRNAADDIYAGMLVVQDVTERKERERELAASEHRYRTLAENFPNGGVGVFDRDLRYTLVTGTMWDDIDPDADDLEDKHVRDALPPDTADDVEPVFRNALEGETGSVVSTLGGRTYRVWATPLRDADGRITAGQSFALDITERIDREQKLERTVEELEESNERLESFASMLAHELRNPVTIGQIYGKQLRDEANSDAVEYITEAFDRIEDMIDVMLVLTRGREAIGESSPLALADVACEAWEGVETQDATLDVDVTRVVQADETYLRHLLRNLFENSVQHGGPDVTVRIGDLPSEASDGSTDESVGVSSGRTEDEARQGAKRTDGGFYVEDDGTGIPPEDREAVFEAGFTTAADSGGTGLGLAFVNELAEVYDWCCTVTESEAGGARFEFREAGCASEE